VWLLDAITLLSLVGIFWARLSLGRNIGFVPAQREIVTRGAYRFVRHPIYSVIFLSILGEAMQRCSVRNLILLGLNVVIWMVKSVIEEGLLRQDPQYAAYMRRVRWRWIPWVA
jgi:protein-S-isoprenylcysteine O-methyltransferase Ste14